MFKCFKQKLPKKRLKPVFGDTFCGPSAPGGSYQAIDG